MSNEIKQLLEILEKYLERPSLDGAQIRQDMRLDIKELIKKIKHDQTTTL